MVEGELQAQPPRCAFDPALVAQRLLQLPLFQLILLGRSQDVNAVARIRATGGRLEVPVVPL